MPKNTPDFLLGENSSKPLLQRKENLSFKETELNLINNIKAIFLGNNLEVPLITFQHVCPALAGQSSSSRFFHGTKFKGFTVAVLNFKSRTKLFSVSFCKEKNFSKLDGRVYALVNMLERLQKQGIEGLYSLTLSEKAQEYFSDKSLEEINKYMNVSRINNWVISKLIRPHKPKAEDKPPHPLTFIKPSVLEKEALEALKEKFEGDVVFNQEHVEHVRYYHTDLFKNLLGTSKFFNSLETENKELDSNGGFTAFGCTFLDPKTNQNLLVITLANCSKEDAYNKSIGVKQCFKNLSKGIYRIYKFPEEASLKDNLLSLLEVMLERTINVEVE